MVKACARSHLTLILTRWSRILAVSGLLLYIVTRDVAFSTLSHQVSTAALRRKERLRPAVATASLSTRTNYNVDVPYAEAAYDPAAANTFFRERPLESASRFAQVVQLSGGFVLNALFDKALQRGDSVVEERSQQLLEVMTNLGPSFIKLGQALSIRTDLLPAPYVKGLAGLQDAVPPFSAAEGRAIIERELGISIDETFSHISSDPVASASIGQVYKATLRSTGEEMAIKVQRPGVLYSVALDIFLMRELLVPFYLESNKDVSTDLVGLVDAWGAGFIDELDYQKEAAATTAFSEAMQKRGLGSVTAPEVVPYLSSAHVLTTKWVDGERLAASGADDVPRLCGVALNAYLTMLLDTGSLHCDPHPGNLLRTPDGRLCILDFGMCLEVPQDLQLALLEFIADLQSKNYERVPEDLVKLRFVPEDKIDELRSSGLTYAITQTLELASSGGGPKGAMEALVSKNKAKYRAADGSELSTKERQRRFREDWQKEMAKDALKRSGKGTSTTADLSQKFEQLQQDNYNVFAIPDYFVYMSRAFATLEGIGLSSNPNYAIISECFPYLAKRLLSDDSPRARGALRTLLYGTGDELNLAKLQEITAGFESYTTSTSSVESSRRVSDEGRKAAAKQLSAVVLSEESNYVQSLLLREAAVSLDATLRDSVASRIATLRSVASPLPTPPEMLASLFTPLTLPFQLMQATLELQDIDARDTKRLENLRILTDLASRTGGSISEGPRSFRGNEMGSLAREAAARSTALARIGVRFSGALAAAQAERLRQRGTNKSSTQSALAGQLAAVGAQTLEGVANVIDSLDRNIAARSATETSSSSSRLRGTQKL